MFSPTMILMIWFSNMTPFSHLRVKRILSLTRWLVLRPSALANHQTLFDLARTVLLLLLGAWFLTCLLGSLNHLLCSSSFAGNDPTWLIFCRWVETIYQFRFVYTSLFEGFLSCCMISENLQSFLAADRRSRPKKRPGRGDSRDLRKPR